jgi:hypothetical protein
LIITEYDIPNGIFGIGEEQRWITSETLLQLRPATVRVEFRAGVAVVL